MTQNKLNFDTENLVVDYISFNIESLIDPKPIAYSLFQSSLGFNSTITENEKLKIQFSTFRNKYQVSFRQYNYKPESKSYWVGTKINFSGKSFSKPIILLINLSKTTNSCHHTSNQIQGLKSTLL